MTDPFTARRRAAADRVLRLVDHFAGRSEDRFERAHDLWCRTAGNYDWPIGPGWRLP